LTPLAQHQLSFFNRFVVLAMMGLATCAIVSGLSVNTTPEKQLTACRDTASSMGDAGTCPVDMFLAIERVDDKTYVICRCVQPKTFIILAPDIPKLPDEPQIIFPSKERDYVDL